MLWILALAKARSAVPISSAISAKRATKANAKINATVDGARQKGNWLRRSVVTAHCGDAPPSLLAIRPSASTRDPLQYFNSLLSDESQELIRVAMTELNLSARAYDRILKVSRTVADLESGDDITTEHVSEAIQYRTFDRTLWV